MSADEGKVQKIFTKRCPFCSAILGLGEKECHACKRKVGDPDKHGVATVPGRWKSYVSFGVSFAVLVVYLYWAFLK